MHTIPYKLVRLRDLQGLSQEQLAFFFGVSQTAYCNWETGKDHPSWNHLNTIATYYQLSVSALLDVDIDGLLIHVVKIGLVKPPIRVELK